MRTIFTQAVVFLVAVLFMTAPATATEEVLMVRIISSDLAAKIAKGAVHACRKKGYQATAVVLDRNGDIMAAQRDTLASRYTLEIAKRKAGTVILSGVNSGDMLKNRGDIRPELNHMQGLIIMGGGLQIRAAGSLVGAVGVSGAPGGDIDAECAQAGLDAVQETLDFAD
ncbi:MAG: heme-binding protein [Rhodospirillales bacterium]|nr:heme-binding protein [Alphaproteobacteria bacterium]MBL6947435.1 heme-binding protein [Rhodospirillales bacterium]